MATTVLADQHGRPADVAELAATPRYTEASFAASLNPLMEPAFRMVRAAGSSPDDAADIVQDACIRAWRHREQCRGEFRPWFLAIVYREARRPRRRWLTLPAFWGRAGDDPAGDTGLSSDVAASMARLPSRQRLALSLRYGADLPIADVARVLHISEPAAKQLLARAREGLRTALTAIREVS